jgi:dUTP pyrophosphatase
MRIKIKRFDKNLPLPEHKTKLAAAFDLCARTSVVIKPKAVGYVPLNVAIETPEGHFLLLAARSSTHKKGLMIANGIGIVDPDFSGDSDESQAIMYNFMNKPVKIEKGDRIMQGIFIKKEIFLWNEVEKMGNKTRGGIGSTGKR